MKNWMGNENGNKKKRLSYIAYAPRHVQSDLCHKFLSHEFYSNEERLLFCVVWQMMHAFYIQMSGEEANN